MFVDKATVSVKAGDGGNGVISFRHEKFVEKGGPDGGDGGKGGDVIFLATRNENTLANFRYQKELKAESGGAGEHRRMHGKNGEDLIVHVPVGTEVVDENGKLVADLAVDGQQAVIAKGGLGGYGNAHFVSSRRQAPRIAEKGEDGAALLADLELKMIADIGLVGLPNAGKSTLLSVVSNARPEIADYPFTTLTPNLGVVDVDKHTSLLFADIPGLIEGAAEGKGLGDEFLRHVERTAILAHLVDAYQTDVASAYETVNKELSAYKADMSNKPQVVVLTKIEGLDADIVNDQLKKLKKVVPKGTEVVTLSAQSGDGLKELLRLLARKVQAYRRVMEKSELTEDLSIPVITLDADAATWTVTNEGDGMFVVRGQKIEKFAAKTYFSNEESIDRLKNILKRTGIMHELHRAGIKTGDTIKIGDAGQFVLE